MPRAYKYLSAVLAGAVVAAGLAYYLRPLAFFDLAAAAYRAYLGLSSSRIEVADHEWVFDEGGSGDTLVLIHGFAGSRVDWYQTLRYFSGEYHLLIPDMPGWGASQRRLDADYGVEAQAERLAAFLAARGVSRGRLVGHSMGGHIAGVLAARHPELVASLTLVANSGVHFEINPFARAILEGGNPFNVVDRADLERLLHQIYLQPPRLSAHVADAIVADNIANHEFYSNVLRRLRNGAGAFVLEGELSRLTMPVHVIWCRHDQVLDVSSVDTMRTLLPQGKYSIIEAGCSHMPMDELPAELARLIEDFWGRTSTSS